MCPQHLSPEASPLSTRSSRYSPRESESEPTPALPRRAGEAGSASQRIREAITRTRRESTSSAKCESSGSEGVRCGRSAEPGLLPGHAKPRGAEEPPYRDSATSAGEDEHEELLRDPGRPATGPQARVMLRRRRQFDAQGE